MRRRSLQTEIGITGNWVQRTKSEDRESMQLQKIMRPKCHVNIVSLLPQKRPLIETMHQRYVCLNFLICNYKCVFF